MNDHPTQPPLGATPSAKPSATPEPSATPRTDAEIFPAHDGTQDLFAVSPHFARTLETELATARAALAQCEERLTLATQGRWAQWELERAKYGAMKLDLLFENPKPQSVIFDLSERLHDTEAKLTALTAAHAKALEDGKRAREAAHQANELRFARNYGLMSGTLLALCHQVDDATKTRIESVLKEVGELASARATLPATTRKGGAL